MTALKKLADLIERLSTIGGWVAAGAVAAIVVLVTVEMLSRAVLGVSTQISDEMCGYLNVAVVFLGMAVSLKDGVHVRVELLYERFKGNWALAVRWLIVVTSLMYLIVTTAVLSKYVSYSFSRGLVSTSVAETPLWLPQSIAVIGSAMLVLQLAAFLLRGGKSVP